MSRMNVARSRADKTASKIALSSATPVTHDIVAGKFTDHDWSLMLERDDADDFIAELLEELTDNVDQIIYRNYIQRQLIPYTVSQAKDAILQIIEWQFLARDDGEFDVETGVTVDGLPVDAEPLPAVNDCWAQGAVPKVLARPLMTSHTDLFASGDSYVHSRPSSQLSQAFSETARPASQLSQSATQQHSPIDGKPVDVGAVGDGKLLPMSNEYQQLPDETFPTERDSHQPELDPDVIDTCGAPEIPDAPVLWPSAADGTDQNSSLSDVQKRRTGVTSGSQPVMIQSETEGSKSSQTPGRKSSSKKVKSRDSSVADAVELEVEISPAGKKKISLKPAFGEQDACSSLHFKKIDPRQLPKNQVDTVYCVIDPSIQEAEEHRKALRNGRRPFCPPGRKSAGADTKHISQEMIFSSPLDPFSTYQPSLVDTMELSGGVVLHEKGRIKKGPKQRSRVEATAMLNTAIHNGLKPIRMQHCTEPLLSTDLLDCQVPVIRPLTDTPPIPPITQSQQIASN